MLKSEDEKYILNLLIHTKLNGALLSYKKILSGYVGYVYRVEVHTQNGKEVFVVKLSSVDQDPSEEAQVNDRIYGTSFEDYTSVLETYNTAVKAGIPIFKLYSFGLPDKDIPFVYEIMSFLHGETVQEFLVYSDHEQWNELQALAGDIVGKLHSITRLYDGAVIRSKPFPIRWRDAFFISFDFRLRAALKLKISFLNKYQKDIKAYIDRGKNIWEDPPEFVFSHSDGFQGVARFENNQWKFLGIVDIEDHLFTDQRFVLAGYELHMNSHNKETPQSFWEAYQKNKTIPPSYYSLRDLFQLYYLLSWFDVSDAAEQYDTDHNEKFIGKSEELITKIIFS